ncbi:hypothetical protein N0V93_005555 [Gnomoniopsis smithogilvyi]|uniref:Uncharacterized protein n=1 Tax=Gnomoniopsis smithogilvyi TaxID=1191159 RepID=A0A9W8YUU6_9PEZI|nr:hypothetical protein N0V93_005555 [Gnomoniopsis smithogilvyi]
MQFNIISIITALMATSVLATHELGSTCSDPKNYETYGCSNDECSVIQCVPKGNGAYYWAYSESCIGIKCENGACNSAYAKSSCTA